MLDDDYAVGYKGSVVGSRRSFAFLYTILFCERFAVREGVCSSGVDEEDGRHRAKG